ncbi:phosphatidate cytidylyltransferase [Cryobacterium sp. LW097]|uniref:phosphatidate cytidylyltransferase n=1 Tax=unclassified Cryobacterium TaxID=2649013 RepID=UPI000B4C4B81|nr:MULTISPECIES: phosphatidate cytidylyltransferase [unclassified Cryobacterium]ASD22399.1 phosphatidate cytidylyltransferase [Cryobacterium sp. LW097]TFC55868.1 phosphatidate cytidylyltransferase [Cryobacterium sp. TMB3-1-2]TFC57370.1 phosphatidate cytidylyltransferase [Cryobacterium sp. TMB1-7]TFC72998.1 phosphatidate cytidylyltransferase [Cryobacterium sp. TMB3-15]TFC76504.1 phosphatidate cytidylyltransferase [Cryobacterium sp. TMB3-10]
MTDQPGPTQPPQRGRGTGRAEFRAQVQSTKADIERQVQATKAQLDATNERIEARTGRNLILATLIGLVLGGAMLVSLIFIKELFMIMAFVVVGFTAFELAEALRRGGRKVPRIPVLASAVAVVPAAFYWGAGGQWLATLGGILLITLWRLAMLAFPRHRAPRSVVLTDIGGGFLIQVYVVFLASFAVLLVTQEGGQWWTLAFLLLVISADTAAYAAGLSFGKHRMVPSISPKKTWEGFAGAAIVCVVVGILLAIFMLGEPWWFGPIFGVVILITATFGDLAESLIKRDLGIKDMSSWLPGHGGFLDRLDSILPSAAAAYALYLIFA